MAERWYRTNNLGWSDVRTTIWAPDPTAAGRKIKLGPLIAVGLALCKGG